MAGDMNEADDRMRILGLSDPLNAPTGFGRVARELFERLPRDFRLGYLSRGWVGSGNFADVTCYSGGDHWGMCQDALPMAVADFVGAGDPFLLWTLLDPWQVGWLSMPETDRHSTPVSQPSLANASIYGGVFISS
jgi:hypothetical protein